MRKNCDWMYQKVPRNKNRNSKVPYLEYDGVGKVEYISTK